MAELEGTQDRANGAAERLTDPNPDPGHTIKNRLDDREALVLLFTVAMLPSFVIPTRLELDGSCTLGWIWGFLGIITASCLLNYFTLNILNKVASVK